MNSPQRNTFVLMEQFANSVLVESARDIWERIGAYSEKKIHPHRKNEKETFWETALCRVNSNLRVTLFFSLSSLLTLFSLNLQWDISEHIEVYGDKGNIHVWKLGRSFLRNSFVICEFTSLSYTVLFIEQFANTVSLDSAMGYFRAYSCLWWQIK